jgi:hypothetical protein
MHANFRSDVLKDAISLATNLVTGATEVLLTAKKVKLVDDSIEEKPKSSKKEGKKEKKADKIKTDKTKVPFSGNGALYVEAAEGNVYVNIAVPANILQEGELCVNVEYLKGLRLADNVEFKRDKNRMKFTSGRGGGMFDVQEDTAKLKGQRPLKTFEPEVPVPSSVLRRLVESTHIIPTLAAADVLPLKVKITDGKLIGYCSESYRACHFETSCPTKKDLDVLLDPSTLSLLTRKLGATTMIGVKKGIFQLKTPTMTCYVPTVQKDDIEDIDQRVKALRKAIKKKEEGAVAKANFNVSAELLTKALGNASSINVGAITPSVQVVCDISAKELKLTVAAAHGKMHDAVEIEDGPKKSVKVGLSSKYMSEMLGMLSRTSVRVSVFGEFVRIETPDHEATMLLATTEL